MPQAHRPCRRGYRHPCLCEPENPKLRPTIPAGHARRQDNRGKWKSGCPHRPRHSRKYCLPAAFRRPSRPKSAQPRRQELLYLYYPAYFYCFYCIIITHYICNGSYTSMQMQCKYTLYVIKNKIIYALHCDIDTNHKHLMPFFLNIVTTRRHKTYIYAQLHCYCYTLALHMLCNMFPIQNLRRPRK